MGDVHPTRSNTRVIQQFWEFVAQYPERPPAEIIRDDSEGDQAIFVFGSRNTLVPKWAADVFMSMRGTCPAKDVPVMLTGRPSIRDNDPSAPIEAEYFRSVMLKEGVPSRLIWVETESRNTLENVQCGMRRFREAGITPRRLFLVGVGFQMRRAIATFQQQLGVRFDCDLVPCPLEGNPLASTGYTSERLVQALATEVMRLVDYAARGHIARVDVPHELIQLATELGVLNAPPPVDRETALPEAPLL